MSCRKGGHDFRRALSKLAKGRMRWRSFVQLTMLLAKSEQNGREDFLFSGGEKTHQIKENRRGNGIELGYKRGGR